MHKAMLTRGVSLLVVMAGLALSGCGSDNAKTSPAPYEGQWSYEGMGTTVLNLRSDSAFSNIGWGSVIGTDLEIAFKGTYTFTPDTAGDLTRGTLNLHITHGYNLITNIWEENPADDSFHCVIDTAASPKTMTRDGVPNPYQYYGPQADIPATLP